MGGCVRGVCVCGGGGPRVQPWAFKGHSYRHSRGIRGHSVRNSGIQAFGTVPGCSFVVVLTLSGPRDSGESILFIILKKTSMDKVCEVVRARMRSGVVTWGLLDG